MLEGGLVDGAIVGGGDEGDRVPRLDGPVADVHGRALGVDDGTGPVLVDGHRAGRRGRRGAERRGLVGARAEAGDGDGTGGDRDDGHGGRRHQRAAATTLPPAGLGEHDVEVEVGYGDPVGVAAQQVAQGLGHDVTVRSVGAVSSKARLPRSRARPVETWLLTVPTEHPITSAVWASVRSE